MKESDSAPILARDRARSLRAAATAAERRLWQRLRNRQLKGAKFRRQHQIGPYIADLFCLRARLVIELDGGQHDEQTQREADERRTEYLQAQGYTVLRFWNNEVLQNVDGVKQLQNISKGPQPALRAGLSRQGEASGRGAFGHE
jgi:very-short-patch-repair endonuclease